MTMWSSVAMRALEKRIAQALLVRSPILLRGERGVGKSRTAHAIHFASPWRRNDEMPSITGGQWGDSDRFVIELVGHERGAYTGATEAREGLYERADGGSLFLDEVQDLPRSHQRALKELLVTGSLRRLGGRTVRKVRVRLICATNADDETLQERLDHDFYDRIARIEIVIPSLRQCREDLPQMWSMAWERFAEEEGVDVSAIAAVEPLVLELLRGHPLRRNWRDLERLAIHLIMVLKAEGRLGQTATMQVIEDFCRDDARKPTSTTAPYPGPRIQPVKNGHDENYFKRLEAKLGPGFERLLQARAARPSATTRTLLIELLGNRRRAEIAEHFMRRIFPER